MSSPQKKVLIVEDDAAIRTALCEAVENDGHAVLAASDGGKAVALFSQQPFDLVLLDLMMPVMNGYDVCRKIREANKTIPILMLTAKGDEIDKVLGLELGADDYVTKPFGVRELLARVHAAFRRQDALGAKAESKPSVKEGETFLFGGTTIDRRRFTATNGKDIQELTARELHLLEVFHRRKGEVLSRDELLNEVWGIDYQGTTRTLDQHVAQVRKKVEVSEEAKVIKTIHGVGYQYLG